VTADTLRASVQAVPALAGATIGSTTNAGAAEGLPTLACSAAAPTPVSSAHSNGGAPGTADPDATNGGAMLPATGTTPGLALVGLALLCVGGLFVLLARPGHTRQ
jgi:hypothetical protein